MTKVNIDKHHDPDLLNKVKLESDDDIDERSVAKAVANLDDSDVVYVHLTEKQWDELGIRSGLWGQSRVVDNTVICYGRWHENARYQRSDKYPEPVKSMAEQTIGIAHEISHGASRLHGVEDLTHAYFYGYKRLKNDDDQKRWEAKPRPIAGMQHALNDRRELNVLAIRTIPRTDGWDREVEDIKKIINPGGQSKKEETKKEQKVIPRDPTIVRRYLQPQSKYSWPDIKPRGVILHTLDGSIEGSYSWLKQTELSYHYLIDLDGSIYNQIKAIRAAWHAGRTYQMSDQARKLLGTVNPNRLMWGIAFAGRAPDKITKEQVASCVSLLKELEHDFSIDLNEDNILTHNDITSYKYPVVQNYRLQVLDALEGGKQPKHKKNTEQLRQELRQNQNRLVKLLQKLVNNLTASSA